MHMDGLPSPGPGSRVSAGALLCGAWGERKEVAVWTKLDNIKRYESPVDQARRLIGGLKFPRFGGGDIGS